MPKPASLPKPAPFTRRWASVREVAELMGLHPMTCYDYAKRGLLPAIHIGRSVRIDLRRLEEQLGTQLERRGRRRP